jgi:hypothetical protein
VRVVAVDQRVKVGFGVAGYGCDGVANFARVIMPYRVSVIG